MAEIRTLAKVVPFTAKKSFAAQPFPYDLELAVAAEGENHNDNVPLCVRPT
jgi:hypothetical protein